MSLSTQKTMKLKTDLIQISQSGQLRKGEKLYARYKNEVISDVDIWNIFAGINSKKNNYKEVLNCCKHILKLTPNNFQVMYNAGVAAQHLSDLENAINYYENCISINPKYINAYSNCAFVYELTGNFEKAITYYQQALKSNDTPELRIQLGRTLASSGDIRSALNQFHYVYDKNPDNEMAIFQIAKLHYETANYTESETYYQKLLSSNENNATVLNNIGRLYEETGDNDKAIDYFQRAIEKDNKIALLYRNLGKVLLKKKELVNAEKVFKQSLDIEPHPESYFNLGKILAENDNLDSAQKYFEKALDMDIPADVEKPEEFQLAVKYFLSSINDPENFNQDKKSFVADLFDGYADKFDSHLVDKLEYKTPELIRIIFEKYQTSKTENIIDLGCGTGLCAHFLKPYTDNLIGIDLSQKMIDKADELKLYNQLIVGEITEEINNLDVALGTIVAADVFVYVGGLKDIFTACSKKMKPGTIFIFSTETTIDDTEDYKLYDSGRYKHSTDYLNKVSNETGFSVIQHEECTLRKERGIPVKGLISLIKKI